MSRGTSARTTLAAAAAALLLVAGCDDGADQSAPPGAPAEQETRAEPEAPAAGEEPSGSEEDAAGAEPDTGTGAEPDTENTPEGESAESITGDPCSDLTPEDVGAVLGNEVGDLDGTTDLPTPEGVDSEGLVICQYGPAARDDFGASMYWFMPTADYPDEMPEEVREEQEESRRTQMMGSGEEIEVEGASAARVEITDALGLTHLTVKAIAGDVVLWSTVFGAEGTLDESDIPSAAELAELAISRA